MSRANRIARLIALNANAEAVLMKHLEGQHDQSTHGSWAGGSVDASWANAPHAGEPTQGVAYRGLVLSYGDNPKEPTNQDIFDSFANASKRGVGIADVLGAHWTSDENTAFRYSTGDHNLSSWWTRGGIGIEEPKTVYGVLIEAHQATENSKGDNPFYMVGEHGVRAPNIYWTTNLKGKLIKRTRNETGSPTTKVVREFTIPNDLKIIAPQFEDTYGSYARSLEEKRQNSSLTKHMQGKHDQSTHGSWDSDRSNNKSDYKYPVQDAIDAVKAGKVGYVSPLDAEFWLKKMGDAEGNPDLTNLDIVGTRFFTRDNLGIPREKMPQVPSSAKEEFFKEMDKHGVKVIRQDVDPQDLHPIQSEISATKTASIMKDVKENGFSGKDKHRIVISSDGYVIDGHHRWAAALFLSMRNDVSLPVLRVEMKHRELIKAVLAWNKLVGIQSIGLGENNKTFKKALVEFDLAVIEGVLSTVLEKHLAGQHDQESHGRRYSDTVNPEVVHQIMERTKEWGGLSVKLHSGDLPEDGFMVSRDSDKFGMVVSPKDYFDRQRGIDVLSEFLRKNKKDLGSGKAWLGVWYQKTHKVDGKEVRLPKQEWMIHLDVTDQIADRSRAINLGKRRNQIAIWDVVNSDEIFVGGKGGGKRA